MTDYTQIIGKREIKYKVWDTKNKEWFDDSLIKLGQDGKLYFWDMGKKMIEPLDDSYITVFYTGLKDKNGVEIYEGDIVTFDGNMTADNSLGFEPNGYIYDEDSKHAVIWNEDMAIWELHFDENEEWKYMRDTRGLLVEGRCEVIGNVFENPELLP